MRERWRKLICRLKGHDSGCFQPWGGWPSSTFGIRSRCRRCGSDTSVWMPSRFVITREQAEGSDHHG